jgi:hypothetical protein
MKAVEDRRRGLGAVEIQGFPRDIVMALVCRITRLKNTST